MVVTVAATASRVAARRIPRKHLLKGHFGSLVSPCSCTPAMAVAGEHCEIVATHRQEIC